MQDIHNHKKEYSEADELSLYKKASRRAGFKMHAGIFILANLLLWVVWFFVFRNSDSIVRSQTGNAILFFSIAWLIVIIAHFLIVYKWNKSMVEKELENLKKELREKERELKNLKENHPQTPVSK